MCNRCNETDSAEEALDGKKDMKNVEDADRTCDHFGVLGVP